MSVSRLWWMAQQHEQAGKWIAALQLITDNGLFLRKLADIPSLTPVLRIIIRCCYRQTIEKNNLRAFQAIESLTRSSYVGEYFTPLVLAEGLALAYDAGRQINPYNLNSLALNDDNCTTENSGGLSDLTPHPDMSFSPNSYYSIKYDEGPRMRQKDFSPREQVSSLMSRGMYCTSFSSGAYSIFELISPVEYIAEWVRRKIIRHARQGKAENVSKIGQRNNSTDHLTNSGTTFYPEIFQKTGMCASNNDVHRETSRKIELDAEELDRVDIFEPETFSFPSTVTQELSSYSLSRERTDFPSVHFCPLIHERCSKGFWYESLQALQDSCRPIDGHRQEIGADVLSSAFRDSFPSFSPEAVASHFSAYRIYQQVPTLHEIRRAFQHTVQSWKASLRVLEESRVLLNRCTSESIDSVFPSNDIQTKYISSYAPKKLFYPVIQEYALHSMRTCWYASLSFWNQIHARLPSRFRRRAESRMLNIMRRHGRWREVLRLCGIDFSSKQRIKKRNDNSVATSFSQNFVTTNETVDPLSPVELMESLRRCPRLLAPLRQAMWCRGLAASHFTRQVISSQSALRPVVLPWKQHSSKPSLQDTLHPCADLQHAREMLRRITSQVLCTEIASAMSYHTQMARPRTGPELVAHTLYTHAFRGQWEKALALHLCVPSPNKHETSAALLACPPGILIQLLQRGVQQEQLMLPYRMRMPYYGLLCHRLLSDTSQASFWSTALALAAEARSHSTVAVSIKKGTQNLVFHGGISGEKDGAHSYTDEIIPPHTFLDFWASARERRSTGYAMPIRFILQNLGMRLGSHCGTMNSFSLCSVENAEDELPDTSYQHQKASLVKLVVKLLLLCRSSEELDLVHQHTPYFISHEVSKEFKKSSALINAYTPL